MLVINVILINNQYFSLVHRLYNTYVNWHLVDMNPLLNTKLGHKNIKRRLKNTNNFGLANDRTVSLCEVRNENTQVEMS